MTKLKLGKSLRGEFPIFENNKRTRADGTILPLAYLDSAATAQKPRAVIDATLRQLERDYATVHRGVYELSARSSDRYEHVRLRTAQFLSPLLGPENIVFTRGTTESINILAHGIGESLLNEGDRIVLPSAEHHANLLPWQQLALSKNCEIAYIPLKGKKDGELTLDLGAAEKLITKNTRVVTLAHMGNVLGQINPVQEIAKMAKHLGALVIVDAAQSISCLPDDLFSWDVDAVCFSSHKMYGPSGLGVLAARSSLLEAIPPLLFGGGMIANVTLEGCELAAPPTKFEAGTPPISEVLVFESAIDWLESLGRTNVHTHAARLATRLRQGLLSVPEVEVYSPASGQETLVSFRHTRVHAHDLATFLDSENVAVRAGHHCAWPLIRSLGVDALVRASFAAYSDEDDVEACLRAINKAANFL